MSWPKGKSRRKQRLYRAHKKWRAKNQENGLTADGKTRCRGRWHRHYDLDRLPDIQRRREVKRRWLQRERYDKGLTQMGTPRKQKMLPALEQAWREFRSQFETIEPVARGLTTDYHE